MSSKSKAVWIVFACGTVVVTALYAWKSFQGMDNRTTQTAPAATGPERLPMDGAHSEHTGMEVSTSTDTPGTPEVFISPERQQLIGVKTAVVEHKPLIREIRTVGKVAFDETKIAHIHTKVAGYVEDVFADFVGKHVQQGEPLFTIYSPDLLATQEEYLLALRSAQELKDSRFEWISKGSNNLLEAARSRLRLWDVRDDEIDELERTGKAKRALSVYSPVTGIITQREAYHHGKYVSPEMELYTLVDLSTVWILGEAYESELSDLKVGQTVVVQFPYTTGAKERTGKITFISPVVNPMTRSAEVRVEFSNSDMSLRPDMFVHFTARVNRGTPLVVPRDALLDSGTEQYVFVDKGQGYFEPRRVKVATETGEFYGIASGLSAGERVVMAANFILDSESRLRGAFAGMGAPASGPAKPAEAQTQGLQLQIAEPRTAKVGMNPVRLTLKDAADSPLLDAEVEISLFMPQMGSIAPMRSAAQLRTMGNGEYTGQIEVPMAWTWETTVTAKKQGQLIGSAKTNITAR